MEKNLEYCKSLGSGASSFSEFEELILSDSPGSS